MTSQVQTLLICLVASHLLGDYLLQPDWMIKARQQKRQGVFVLHAIIHTILAACLAGLVCDWRGIRFIAAAIFASHWLIDAELKPLVPAQAVEKSWIVEMVVFGADQAVHLITIIACIYVLPLLGTGWTAQWSIPMLDQRTLAHGLVFVSGLVVAVWVGGVVIGIRIKPFLAQLQPRLRDGVLASPLRGFAGGGRTIGLLERFLIFIFVFSGQYAAVGFLIAGKSVLRFGEIKANSDSDSRREPEYVLIGTLMSVAWAVSAAILALQVWSAIR